jgi:hypothetical protein
MLKPAARRPPPDRLGYRAVADQAEGRAVDITAEVLLEETPSLPGARTQPCLGGAHHP